MHTILVVTLVCLSHVNALDTYEAALRTPAYQNLFAVSCTAYDGPVQQFRAMWTTAPSPPWELMALTVGGNTTAGILHDTAVVLWGGLVPPPPYPNAYPAPVSALVVAVKAQVKRQKTPVYNLGIQWRGCFNMASLFEVVATALPDGTSSRAVMGSNAVLNIFANGTITSDASETGLTLFRNAFSGGPFSAAVPARWVQYYTPPDIVGTSLIAGFSASPFGGRHYSPAVWTQLSAGVHAAFASNITLNAILAGMINATLPPAVWQGYSGTVRC